MLKQRYLISMASFLNGVIFCDLSIYIFTTWKFIYSKYLARYYLEIKLITSRPHQIRAQLKNINHPIVDDKKYGDS